MVSSLGLSFFEPFLHTYFAFFTLHPPYNSQMYPLSLLGIFPTSIPVHVRFWWCSYCCVCVLISSCRFSFFLEHAWLPQTPVPRVISAFSFHQKEKGKTKKKQEKPPSFSIRRLRKFLCASSLAASVHYFNRLAFVQIELLKCGSMI